MSRAQKEKEQQAAQLLEHGDLEKAETIYRSLLEEEIISYAVFEKLSYICYMQDRMKEMIPLLRQAIAINPNHPEDYSNLGIALYDQGGVQSAIDVYRQALAIKPDYPEAYYNLGIALKDQGHLQAAADAYRQALAIKPDFPSARFNYSLLLLCSGDYENGWKDYEWRFQTDANKLSVHPSIEPWTGSNLSPDERLVLVSEQGLGDTLQFMRYALYLNNSGLPISLCAPSELHGLIRASGITTMILDTQETSQLTTGKWLPLLSLPGCLQVAPERPLVDTPYISVPAQQVEQWQQKLAHEQRPIVAIN